MLSPALPEQRLIEISENQHKYLAGDRLSYLEAGDSAAPPVVLLHGSGASASFWRHQLAALSPHFRVIAWNTPGYGWSDPLTNSNPSYATYAEVLAEFLTALKIDRAHVVGNSFGAGLALEFAWRFPHQVHRLALSGVSAGARGRNPDGQAKTDTRRSNYFESGSGAFEYARAVIDLVCGPNAEPSVRQEIFSVLATTGTQGYKQVRQATAQADPLAFASTLEAETLFYHGTLDKISPVSAGVLALAEAIAHSRVEMLEGIGHLPELESASQVNPLLLHFLQHGLHT